MASPTGPFSASNQNTVIVSSMDYTDKPQVFHALVNRYPDQYELGWLKAYGMFEEVKGQIYYWHENNLFLDNPFIASFAQVGSTTSVRVTIAAQSHQNSGAYSYPRVGQIVQFTNGLEGRINAKSTTSASAHTIDVFPSKNISYATFSAGIVAGTQFILTGNVFAEGSSGQAQTVVATTTVYSNKIQKFSETAQITFDSMTNQTWIPYEDPLTGEKKDALYIKTLFETEERFMFAEETALFVGTASDSTLVDEDGNALNTTEGLLPTLDNRGTQQTYSGGINVSFYEEATRKMRKNMAGNEYLLLMGLNFMQANVNFLTDFGKNGGIVYSNEKAEKSIEACFSSFKYGSYKIMYKELNALSHPQITGTAGFNYADRAVFMPDPNRRYTDPKLGVEVGPFTVMYKKRTGPVARDGGKYSLGETGFNAGQGPTSKKDVREWTFFSDKGARTAGAIEYINVKKSS